MTEPGANCNECGRRVSCDACRRRTPKPASKPRRRAQKNLSVPVDKLAGLNALIEAAATKPSFGGALGYDINTPDWAVIESSLAYVVQFA